MTLPVLLFQRIHYNRFKMPVAQALFTWSRSLSLVIGSGQTVPVPSWSRCAEIVSVQYLKNNKTINVDQTVYFASRFEMPVAQAPFTRSGHPVW